MNNKQFETENELAVSIVTQQKASLYGLAAVLVGTGKIPNKKKMKRVVKRLRREVKADIGPDGGEELLMQNRGAVEMVVQGIKRNPEYKSEERKKLLGSVIEQWYNSYVKGLKSLNWSEDI